MNKLQSILSKLTSSIKDFFRYKQNYFDYIYFRYRDFDIRGLSVQGSYNLEQQEVFIDVNLSPIDVSQLGIGRLLDQNSTPDEAGKKIWEFINKTAQQGSKLVVVGDPGSGKTTMLKQVALAFSRLKKIYNLPNMTPVLLILRNHAEQIIENPAVELTELIKSSLVNDGFKFKANWFDGKLRKGVCVILLDGLDEIGNEDHREKVVNWVENQIQIYSKNHFIMTTRPHGIFDHPVVGAQTYMVNNLDLDQISDFLFKWYLANEIRRSQKHDPGVEMLAKKGAQDLLSRIQNSVELQPLAQNPLLLTMIALVHRFNAQLPGRRVELYDEIFRVFFRRREAVGVEFSLTPEQSRSVLIPLANHMMLKEVREVNTDIAVEIIRKDLIEVSKGKIEPQEFLNSIEQQSGLLRDIGGGTYAFASKTFQEYLASIYYVDNKNIEKLIREIKNIWWWETIRLYSAQSDATTIIQACLNEPIELQNLELAFYCLDEALRVDLEVSARLDEIINKGVDDPDPKWRNTIAQAILSKRLRWMQRIDARRLIDRNLITNVEYQIFLDEESKKNGMYYYPDQWTGRHFPKREKALSPVTGIRIKDAKAFSEWLIPRDIWRFRYRLPTSSEIALYKAEDMGNEVGYWITDGDIVKTNKAERYVTSKYREFIIDQIVEDSHLFNSMRSALQRELTLKKTDELLASSQFEGSHSAGSSEGYQSMAETQEKKLQMGEWERYGQRKHLEDFRKFSSLFGFDAEKFMEDSKVINVQSRLHVAAFDWVPPFPLPPETGYDLGRAQSAFDKKYPSAAITSLLGKRIELTTHAQKSVAEKILERSWQKMEGFSDDWSEIYAFARMINRISLLTMAFMVPASRRDNDTELEKLCRDIADIYLVYCLLEKRIAGTEIPVEGIRLVKYS